ncbi:MAG: hypothetical protein J0J06_13980 [Sphingomonas sp.]|uniref:hypothetical protein n=1 Tax=Sphingomonas sp. TaxID=28214 RepID=UPI001ACF2446|nr:hypothetical protein [Sphingomonas sp.]MBN8816544.1 hypothetical protein [Sphingomonas sp.]
MWLWDGTDWQESNGEAAFADAVRRAFISANPVLTTQMQKFVAAISIALTNRKSSDLIAPEPFIEGGFTPSDDERDLICETVRRDGRDIVHICFRTREPFTPTGLIVVAYRDGDTVRLHSRTSLVWVAKDRCVRLYGVEDEPDLNCHFTFRPGVKLRRGDGFPTPAGSDELRQAADRVEALITRGVLGDVRDEPLAFSPRLGRCVGGRLRR